MRIVLASSEAGPFARTSDVADLCEGLARELSLLGHSVSLILPAYRQARLCGQPLKPKNIWFDVPVGNKIVRGGFLASRLPGCDAQVFLVEQDFYFNRPELYRERGRDYVDNCERFVFFSRAVLEANRLLSLDAELLHCHDWQTGLVPALAKIEYSHTAGYENLQTLLTIHDVSRQGRFSNWEMTLTGLDWKYFNWRQMEFFGDLCLLKTGLAFADRLCTVSPRYAREIQTPEFGGGLEGVLQHRRDDLSGILSGIDDQAWNPAIDPALPTRYTSATWQAGKAACKAALQSSLGLPMEGERPLVAWLGPFDDDGGARIASDVMNRWAMYKDAQWVAIGTGAKEHEAWLTALARSWPERVALRLENSASLVRQTLAGADMLLLPAWRQPCGARHFQALRYGAAPLVREIGGLADAIVDVTPANLALGAANGFTFREFSPVALEDALARAVNVYHHHPEMWSRVVTTGIHQDWSWGKTARHYSRLYENMTAGALTA